MMKINTQHIQSASHLEDYVLTLVPAGILVAEPVYGLQEGVHAAYETFLQQAQEKCNTDDEEERSPEEIATVMFSKAVFNSLCWTRMSFAPSENQKRQVKHQVTGQPGIPGMKI